MAKRGSRVDRFVEQSIVPTVVAVVTTILTVLFIIGTNATPAMVPRSLEVPIFIALAAMLMATIVTALGRNARRRVSKGYELAALQRIVTVLRMREPSLASHIFDRAGLDLNGGSALGISESTTVAFFVEDNTAPAFRTTMITGGPGVGKSTLLARLAAKVAVDTLKVNSESIPLYASALSWEPGKHLSRWVEFEMQKSFGIRPRVTNTWLHSARAILFVDGVDELSVDGGRTAFLNELRRWQARPSGGKLVVSYRDDNIAELKAAAELLAADRLAQIQPLDKTATRRLFAEILKSSDLFSNFSVTTRLRRQLEFLTSGEGAVSPSSVRAVEKGSARLGGKTGVFEVGQERWASELSKADSTLLAADSDGALRAYLRIADQSQGQIAALALVRASLVEAGLGEISEASRYFSRSLELFNDLSPYLQIGPAFDALTPSEVSVLRLLNSSRPLIEEEIFVRSGMSPSASSEALRGLIRKGFASMNEVGSHRIGFYESTVSAGPRTARS